MNEKHSFGNGVVCGVCGQTVHGAWAASYDEAAAGRGVCDECKGKAASDVDKLGGVGRADEHDHGTGASSKRRPARNS